MKSISVFINALVQRWKTFDESWRFAITVFLIARLFYTIWSWAILIIQPLAVQNLQLAGEPIVSVFSLQTSQAHVYLREVNGQSLTFHSASPRTISDQQTNSIWDVSTGAAVQGQHIGISLSSASTESSDVFPYYRATPYPFKWLAMWQRFDTNWYISIAENGYGGLAGDDHFPPLFPMLIRLLKPMFGSAFLAGLFISHLATLFMLKFLYDAFSEWGGTLVGRRALAFMMIYPTSFFFFSIYTESFFIMTALLSIRYMKIRSWAWAGFWTFCAILTRLQGVALLFPMLYLMWYDQPFLHKRTQWIGLILPAFGGLFYLYLRSRQVTGGPLPFVESDWHARLVPPWETYWYSIQTLLSGNFTFIDLLNWAVVTLFIILLVVGWRKIPLEYNLYAVFSLLIMLIRIVETQPLISMSRYSLTLFPLFFVLGSAGENPWSRRLISYTFLLLNMYLSSQFFIWGWVA